MKDSDMSESISLGKQNILVSSTMTVGGFIVRSYPGYQMEVHGSGTVEQICLLVTHFFVGGGVVALPFTAVHSTVPQRTEVEEALCLDNNTDQLVTSSVSGCWALPVTYLAISQGNGLFLGFALGELQRCTQATCF